MDIARFAETTPMFKIFIFEVSGGVHENYKCLVTLEWVPWRCNVAISHRDEEQTHTRKQVGVSD